MTIQLVCDNRNEQASRLKPPPPSIGDLLQVANSLPPDYPLPDLGEVLRLRLTPDFRKPNPEKGFRDFLDRMRTQFPDFVTALENLEKPHDSVYLRYDEIPSKQIEGHAAKANVVEINQHNERSSPAHAMPMCPLPSVQLHCDIGVMFGQQFSQAIAQGIFNP